MKHKMINMLALQDAMNSKINPDWRQAGNEWYRAIWIECAEMLDHYGWKWWKHQQADLDQVILEIVDIWHFMLSDMLEKTSDQEKLAETLAEQFSESAQADDIRLAIESLASKTLLSKSAEVPAFKEVMSTVSLTLDDLYRGYIGKNVLNFFRQDHGYKDGTYQKVWGGREDNEFLVESAASLDVDSPSFQDDLYSSLKSHYQRLCS
ncbi:MAG: dUTP diphosphatase [Gammaproteobacteria bacterium]